MYIPTQIVPRYLVSPRICYIITYVVMSKREGLYIKDGTCYGMKAVRVAGHHLTWPVHPASDSLLPLEDSFGQPLSSR